MAKNYTIVDEKLLVSGFFDVVEATTEFPSQSGDGTVRTHPMMVMKRTPAATIAVWDPELDVVLMIEEYRVGAALAGLEGEAAWPLSTIAGMVDESADKEAMKGEPQPWEYRSKKSWQKLLIMLGGIIMNVLLAMVIYIIFFVVCSILYFLVFFCICFIIFFKHL